MAIYLVEISVFDDEKRSARVLKDELEDALLNSGFVWGHIDFKKAKIVVND